MNVMQVSSQQEMQDPWNLFRWEHYFMHPQTRAEVLNVISLEFSGTPLADLVQRPRVVDDLDWVTQAWPDSDAERRPKVQLCM